MRRAIKARICGCSHEEPRHELIDGEPVGPCLHGCGCAGFHSRRRGARAIIGVRQAPASPSVAVALAAIEKARAALHEAETALRASPGELRVVSPRPVAKHRSWGPSAGYAKGERRVLIAVAQHPNGVTREQLTVLTGYKRSSRDTYLQRLRHHEYVTDSDRIRVTQAGIRLLGDQYERLPTGEALVAYWRERLPGGELVIFDAILGNGLTPVGREYLSQVTGYKRSSRDTYLQRLRSRELIRSNPDGSVYMSETLRG